MTDSLKQELLARGFVVIRGVLGRDDVISIKKRLRYIAANARFYEAFGVYFTPPAAAVADDPGNALERFQQIGNVPFLDAECRAHLLTQARFAGIATTVLGPSFNVINAGFFVKPAFEGAEVPWHQDAATWGVPPGTWTPADAPLIFDYWLALDPADAQNGTLELLPGSQQLGPVTHTSGSGLLPQADPAAFGIDPAGRIMISAQPGDLVLYHQDLFHRSNPNRSAQPRLAAAGTLIAPSDIARLRLLLPHLATLERCAVYVDGRPVRARSALPEQVGRLRFARRCLRRWIAAKLRLRIARPSF